MNPYLTPTDDATPEAACRDRHRLFLSLDATDHQQAANVCLQECPAVSWCRSQLNAALDSIHGRGVHGTWAGKLYDNGKRVMGKASVGACPQCGAGDGKPCTTANGKVCGRAHRARFYGLPSCAVCHDTFTPDRANMRYCTPECAKEGNRRNRRAIYKQQPMKACEGCLAPTKGRWCTTCSARKGHAAMVAKGQQEWGMSA